MTATEGSACGGQSLTVTASVSDEISFGGDYLQFQIGTNRLSHLAFISSLLVTHSQQSPDYEL